MSATVVGKNGIYGIISFVLGAISITVYEIPLGLAATILGTYAYFIKGDKKGMVGLSLGIVGMLFAVLVMIILRRWSFWW